MFKRSNSFWIEKDFIMTLWLQQFVRIEIFMSDKIVNNKSLKLAIMRSDMDPGWWLIIMNRSFITKVLGQIKPGWPQIGHCIAYITRHGKFRNYFATVGLHQGDINCRPWVWQTHTRPSGMQTSGHKEKEDLWGWATRSWCKFRVHDTPVGTCLQGNLGSVWA